MKYLILVIFLGALIGCSQEKSELPVLETSSSIISIKDGDEFHENNWAISPELELDEFVTRKFKIGRASCRERV